MGLDRMFSTPTVTIDQDKYDELLRIKFLYEGEGKIMDFGKAIQLVKEGKKLQRKGWNGRNQYIALAKNISYENFDGEVTNAEHNAIGNKAIAFVGTSGVQLGWLASQADMLAEDWQVVE